MRITFIRPHLTERRSVDAMEPLVFAILAVLTPTPGSRLHNRLMRENRLIFKRRWIDPAANSRTSYHLGFHLVASLSTRHKLSCKRMHRLGAGTPLEPQFGPVSLRLASSQVWKSKGAEVA